ncbi:MAG: nuclear transport factor 2 family protein [Rhodospirillaceae bacterium]|jgi:ketosteroid isomerase-like protein|nr:nuclear transport factor 2 family protein [Rhodospirillaceae bacterium]MBT5241688.1 nuclear transport factor 2 family protein [Rhodospirillaceae bacterium]MBT5566852.1 nuclear transport factor 2 family protein [Rhodospirillaceae bacterium]MBT6090461.1 nuclear transport factor 2 family protein [Rhodospirillaceae bacterium]MBT6961750.1 nuclear transport factor 2 family protein [Rhodospirillaceae bacterium]
MTASREKLIARATAYFADVDRFDTDAILSHLTDDIVLEVPTGGVRKEGVAAVRETYVKRAGMVRESWHGDFIFTADEDAGRLAIRLAVKRTNKDGSAVEMDNLTLLSFEGDKICAVAVWMSGENSLT